MFRKLPYEKRWFFSMFRKRYARELHTKEPTITCTNEEERLFEILRQVTTELKLNTTIRVAGGWVRDRLLNLPSKDDVDLAIENYTGIEFITKVNEWSLSTGQEQFKFNIIQVNPDKSKHLETGMMFLSYFLFEILFSYLLSHIRSTNTIREFKG